MSRITRYVEDSTVFRGGATLSGVEDISVVDDLTVADDLAVSGKITVGETLGVTGASTLASVGVTGAATVGTTLGVTGKTTLSDLDTTGTVKLGNAATDTCTNVGRMIFRSVTDAGPMTATAGTVGEIVFNTSDSKFYGCTVTNESAATWVNLCYLGS